MTTRPEGGTGQAHPVRPRASTSCSRPPSWVTTTPSGALPDRTAAGCTRTATGCSARCRTPRTRSRSRCSTPGAGCPDSRAAARSDPGSTGSPPTPACGRSSDGPGGCSRSTTAPRPTRTIPGEPLSTVWLEPYPDGPRTRGRLAGPRRPLRAARERRARVHRRPAAPARQAARGADPSGCPRLFGQGGAATLEMTPRRGRHRAAARPQDGRRAAARTKPAGHVASSWRRAAPRAGRRLR